MKWWWTECLEKSGEWLRGKGGLDLSGQTLSHRTDRAWQCWLMEGVCAWPQHLPAHPWPPLPSAGLGMWPEDPWPAAKLPETVGRVFLGFEVIIIRRKAQGWALGTSSALPLWNSCDPWWAGEAISLEHHSSRVKQELKTFTNSVIINCWISLFLGWNYLKWKFCYSNAAQKVETSQVPSVWPLANEIF